MSSAVQKIVRSTLVLQLCASGAMFSGAALQSSAAVARELDTSERASLQISLTQGALRGRSGRFEFFDASDGCSEEYGDIPHRFFGLLSQWIKALQDIAGRLGHSCAPPRW